MCRKISKYYFHGCRSNLRRVIKFKTWYQLLIVNAFNCVFVYAWRLYRTVSDEKISQKDFIIIIITKLDPYKNQTSTSRLIVKLSICLN